LIVFCHLLNDNSGSPVILQQAIRALSGEASNNQLFVGSQGRGCLERAGVPIRRYWYRRSRFRLLTLFTYAASQLFLYRALSRANLPDDALLYVNTLLPFGAALWAHRHGHPVVYHTHEVSISPDPLHRFLVCIAKKTAHRVIYVSEDHLARLRFKNVPSAVVPNPVAPKIAEQGFATPYTPRCTGHFQVLMLASPRDFKGVPEFLDLARRLDGRGDVRFTLVLNADDTEISKYLSKGSVPQNVDVYPRTDAPEHFYATADVLLNLSRVDQCIETFGLTIVEGMAFGLPVIAPPVGGPSEIVTHGQEGFLVDSRDGDELESKLMALVDHPNMAQAMSEAARRRARDFTVKRFAEALRAQIDLLTYSPPPQKKAG